MTDDTRLRRLDALFAERVLGCKIEYDNDGDPCCRCALDVLAAPHGQHDSDGPFWPEIQCYTRSLDAAWEGVGDHEIQLGTDWEVKGRWRCYYDPDWQCGGADLTTYGAHPAEALVLACLRAVGCSEEELK